ncbi:hypothetical protein J4218_00355 [Candidatus Pacearchaeota archaeon]|nr:hypothetical protein [Candidatus Pacearchaeota archaeon]
MKREEIGLIIVLLGVLLSISTSNICNSLCRGYCLQPNNPPCLFLFLFSSICLIVSGASLILAKWN